MSEGLKKFYIVLILGLIFALAACVPSHMPGSVQTKHTCWNLNEVFYEWNYNPYSSYFYLYDAAGRAYAYCVN